MVRVVPGQGGSSDLSEEDFIHVAVQYGFQGLQ
jgi:hypothetical protein